MTLSIDDLVKMMGTTSEEAKPEATEKKKSSLFLNPTIDVPFKNEETGETEILHISLPWGIPVDQIEKFTSFGKGRGGKINAVKNAMIDALVAMKDQIPPGEDAKVPNMYLRLRHVGNADTITQTEGMDDILSLVSGALSLDANDKAA